MEKGKKYFFIGLLVVFLRNREWEWVRDSGKLRVGVVVECMKRRKDEMMEFGQRKGEYGVIKLGVGIDEGYE